ncbi:MAG TPA: hypothetical protein VFG45_07715 [Candidatus Nitrosocosmicus sp.]|nr:hypothetical protein [Candidatus Nitrosocosmicus sp.]
MKITEEIKESKDKYGNVVDFIFCFRCIAFVHINDYGIGDDVKCPECHKDDYVLPDADNPNKKFYR